MAAKKPEPRSAPAVQLVCARIKSVLWDCTYTGEAPVPPKLCAASRPHRQVPHLRQNARHLHPVQLR
ncbi:MAG: hypothetical protein ACRD3Q_00005, partial [Terriglobales bacterium]